MWPSGPMPSITMSNSPAPCGVQLVGVRRRGRSGSSPRRRGRHLVHPGRVAPTASRNAARAWPALRSGEPRADEPLVAPPDLDPGPVDVGLGRESRDLAVQQVGDATAGERDLRVVTRLLGVARRDSSSPATDAARAAASACTSIRGCSSSASPPSWPSGARWRRTTSSSSSRRSSSASSSARSRRFRATGRSGWPGELYVASLPSGRVMLIGPLARVEDDLGDPGPSRASPGDRHLEPVLEPGRSRSALGLTRSA